MLSRQAIYDIPSALRATLGSAPAECQALVRSVRWGEGPLYIGGIGPASTLGLAAGYAFETFLSLPVVALPLGVLQNYTPSLARPRSVLLMISLGEGTPELHELAQVLRRRSSTLILLTNSPETPLAKLADQVLLVRAQGEGEVPGILVCMHAALNLLAVVAAGILKPPAPQQAALEREFEGLADQLDWVLSQHAAGVRSLAAELLRQERLSVVGGGFFHIPALHTARRLQRLAGLAAEGMEITEFALDLPHHPDGVLLLSGSRCKMKKFAHHAAAELRVRGARVLSLTDSNDRELAGRSDLALLLPTLSEAAGCTLSLFLGEWLAVEAERLGTRD